ncbi:3-hydroxybutyryl-CoA dehydrogenase, partial [Candidatus Sumerlaeota bacterium]|nr:3-hydroxybutyryl-CoA dehydrogenase [Candidatus Sumerlaeota bacterium]
MGKTVAVTGVGTMGSGIALVAAQAGWDVRLFDAAPDAVQKSFEKIRESLQQRVEKGKLGESERVAILGRFALCKTLEESLGGVDLYIEAALEDLPVKRQLFAAAAKAAPQEAILATNTSSLSVT